MNKYFLKPEFEKAQIITKNKEGRDVLVTSDTFNDYFAQLMLDNNQGHLITLNRLYDPQSESEKKTFTQVSETVISLTLHPEKIAETLQNQTVQEPESKRKPGRPFKAKG